MASAGAKPAADPTTTPVAMPKAPPAAPRMMTSTKPHRRGHAVSTSALSKGKKINKWYIIVLVVNKKNIHKKCENVVRLFKMMI